MGIIKAVKQAIGGGFADTWQEVIEPDNIGDQTVSARGVLANRGQNKKGSDDMVRAEALRWCQARGQRSGRAAYQFSKHWVGSQQLKQL